MTSRFIRHVGIVDDARELLVTSGDITKELLLMSGVVIGIIYCLLLTPGLFADVHWHHMFDSDAWCSADALSYC